MHRNGIELDLGLLPGRIQLGHRPEGRGAGIGTQDRDVALREFLAQHVTGGGVGQIDRAYLDGDVMACGDPLGEVIEDVAAPGRDDQVVAAAGQIERESLADALGGAGDHRAGVGMGCGYGHGRNRRDH